MVDSSIGVTESNYKMSLSFIDAVAREVGVGGGFVRFGMATMATKAELVFNLADYVDNEDGLSDAVLEQGYARGKLNTAQAIRYAVSSMFRRGKGDRADAKVCWRTTCVRECANKIAYTGAHTHIHTLTQKFTDGTTRVLMISCKAISFSYN